MERVDPEGEDDENNDDILDGELVLRHPRVVSILRTKLNSIDFAFLGFNDKQFVVHFYIIYAKIGSTVFIM